MKKLTWRPLAALALVALFATTVSGGPEVVRRAVLFAGGDTDSTEQASRWIEVGNARRVVIRTWTTHAGFGANADSLKADSLTTFDVLFSDSVSFQGSDSLGTLVTARSTIARTLGTHSEPFPVCADSIVVSAADSARVGVVVGSRPINKQLRGAANGSGIITIIGPVVPGAATADPNGVLGKKYMRIRATPLRRHTLTMWASTSGGRVDGLRGLKMEAYIYYGNQ